MTTMIIRIAGISVALFLIWSTLNPTIVPGTRSGDSSALLRVVNAQK